MICRLCLCLIEENEGVAIFDHKGLEFKISSIIAKHFWFEPKEDDQFLHLCNFCWWKIDTFHTFYLSVKDAQTKFSMVSKEGRNTRKDLKNDQKYDSVPEDDTEAVEYDSTIQPNVLPINRKFSLSPERKKSFIETRKNSVVLTNGETAINETVKVSKKMNAVHNDEKYLGFTSTPNERRLQAIDEKISKFLILKCELCNLIYSNFSEIHVHYREVHNRKGFVICCDKRLYCRSRIMEHISIHENPNCFRCDECNKICSTKDTLYRHIAGRHSVKNHKCDQCSFSFITQKLLDKHKLCHMPVEQRKFLCEICNKAYPTENMLKTHIRRTHEKANARICDVCAKVITGRHLFEKHRREHDGIVEPKVQCKECGSWFKDNRILKRHMDLHIRPTEKQICNLCGKEAPTQKALQSHIRFVHKMKCQFQCGICDKSFKFPRLLKEHIASHTGEKLYKCSHCPKTCAAKANLYSHKKRMHPKEWEESKRQNNHVPIDSSLT